MASSKPAIRPKKKNNVPRIVLFAAIPVVLAALVLTGFFTFRRTLARFSMDFYYPFFQAAKHVELSAARQALALQPRQKLALAVEQLQRQNAMLAAQVQRLREMEADNERLRQELRMPRWSGYNEVYAEVILRDPSTWSEQFVISKGLNDGIETGDLVLTFDFAPRGGTPSCVLAGRVVETSARTSVVATIVNPACRLSVTLAESGANGTLYDSTAGGVGFTAITVCWLAQLNPFAMIAIAFMLGVLSKGASTLQTSLSIPASISDIITGIILLCMLGCEFFINYRMIFRGHTEGKEAA